MIEMTKLPRGKPLPDHPSGRMLVSFDPKDNMVVLGINVHGTHIFMGLPCDVVLAALVLYKAHCPEIMLAGGTDERND